MGYCYQLANAVFILAGVALLTIHWIATGHLVEPTTVPMTPGCKQVMHPWFASEYSCAVFELNCYHRGVDSIAADELEFLDEGVTQFLRIPWQTNERSAVASWSEAAMWNLVNVLSE